MIRLLPRMLAAAVALLSQAGATAATLAFRHVNVVDVEHGRILADRVVLVRGNRIDRIARDATFQVPADAQIIEAAGKFLMPGLWDMHAHNFNYVSGRPPRTWQFPLFIAYGVTGVRDMWVKAKDMPLVRQWRTDLDRGEFVGPRFAAVGTIVDGPEDAKPGHFPGPNVDVAPTPEAGRRMVDGLQAAGVDFFKTYNSLSRDVYLAVVDEGKRRHLPVAGHVPWAVGARLASDSGQRSVEHEYGMMESCSSKERELYAREQKDLRWAYSNDSLLVDSYSEEACLSLAATFARNHTAFTPTLVEDRFSAGTETLGFFIGDPRLATVPQNELDSWQDARDLLRKGLAKGTMTPQDDAISARWWKELFTITRLMEQQGVTILAGTDVGNPFIYPGASLLDELGLLNDAGLTPLQALQAATLNPAKFLHIEKDFGTVERGKTADLVLLDANPLEDIANTRRIDAVVLNGRLFDRSTLDALLASAKRSVH